MLFRLQARAAFSDRVDLATATAFRLKPEARRRNVRDWRRMAPVVPDPKKIKAFKSEAAFDDLDARESRSREPKSGCASTRRAPASRSVTNTAGAGRGSLLGLDRRHPQGIRRASRFCSAIRRGGRRASGARSIASTSRRLTAAGRMQPAGQRQVDAAKADGRWDAAYAPMRSASEALDPRGPARRDRGQSAGAQDVRDAGPPEPLRAGLSHQQHEDRGRPGAEDRRAGRMLARGETIFPERGRARGSRGR